MKTHIINGVPQVGALADGQLAYIDCTVDGGPPLRLAVHHERVGALLHSLLVAAGAAASDRGDTPDREGFTHLFPLHSFGVAPIAERPSLALRLEVEPGVTLGFELSAQSSLQLGQALTRWAASVSHGEAPSTRQ